jgi:KUP system potassium uptake protein
VDPGDRVRIEPLGNGFWRVTVTYGFMDDPDIPPVLEAIDDPALQLDPRKVTYFLGRETLIPTRKVEGMALWREKLYVAMSRNATTATNYFCLPPNQVVELGAQIEI